MRRVLVVEDKYLDFVEAKGILEKEIPGVIVDHLMTELTFRRWLDDPKAFIPDLLILDNKLPWTESSPDVELAPQEVLKAGPTNAGLRCYGMLRAHPARFQIPVIMLTGLSIVCPVGVACVQKTERSNLAAKVRILLGRRDEKELADGN